MVPLATTRSGFEAKVLIARLGADGILAQLQGGNVDSLYPVGAFDIFVDEDDLDRARELLEEGTGELTDEDDDYGEEQASRRTEWWMAAILVAFLALFIALRIFSL
jgi:hypothetical protein